MFDAIFAHATGWIASNLPLAALASFAWGLGAVLFSPCHLAAIPVLAAHAAGYTRLPADHEGTPPPPGMDISLLFALGYFLAIAGLGVACALVGRVFDLEGLGEHFWFAPAGLLLIWFGYSLWREHSCSGASRTLQGLGRRLGLGARGGSLALGVGYGLLSSGCTLAFLAPVLVLSLPHGVLPSAVMAVGFGLGHCLPMALVGVLTPLARRLMRVCRLNFGEHSHGAQGHEHHHAAERRFRKAAAVVICLAGLVLLLHPLLE